MYIYIYIYLEISFYWNVKIAFPPLPSFLNSTSTLGVNLITSSVPKFLFIIGRKEEGK